MKNTGNDAAASPGDRGSDPQAERSERASAAGISGGVTAHDSGGGQGPCAIRAERPVAGGDTPSMRRAPEAAAANIRRSSSPARVAATATDNKADTTAPDSSPRRAADRMASERGDVAQRGVVTQPLHDLAAADESPQRHPAAEGFGQADDVGGHAVPLHGEQRSRAPHAGLYLVENQ